MRSAPAKIPFPCWSQSWVSLRTAFGLFRGRECA